MWISYGVFTYRFAGFYISNIRLNLTCIPLPTASLVTTRSSYICNRVGVFYVYICIAFFLQILDQTLPAFVTPQLPALSSHHICIIMFYLIQLCASISYPIFRVSDSPILWRLLARAWHDIPGSDDNNMLLSLSAIIIIPGDMMMTIQCIIWSLGSSKHYLLTQV